MNWIYPNEPDPASVAELVSFLSTTQPFPEPLARLLLLRGISTPEACRDFLKPGTQQLSPPASIRNLDKAAHRILEYLRQGNKILVYGDYDVDGTTSVALACLFFQQHGFAFEYYIPDREKEGYGMSFEGMQYAEANGISLVLALDCGTKDHAKVAFAASRGIDVIICDHHEPGDAEPPAYAFINPKSPHCTSAFREFSACGITFKLIWRMLELMKADATPDEILNRYGDLVALSTACDIVPMMDENRVLVHAGITKLRTDPLPGLKRMMEFSTEERDWNVRDLVFFLGPRINAAGRMGTARTAVDLLLGKPEALELFAHHLEQSNEKRKETDREITRHAVTMIESNTENRNAAATVLYHPDWHKGVIGIVASRLIEKYYRPTILLTYSENRWVGSGRSIPGFDLHAALEHCADELMQFGGHMYAGGLSLKTENLDRFKEKFLRFSAEKLGGRSSEPELEIAAKMDFTYIGERLIRLLDRFEPFGPGNMEPVFATDGVQVKQVKILKEEHVRMELEQRGIRFTAIGFGLAEKWRQFPSGRIRIAYQPGINQWNGNRQIQLRLKDYQPE